MKKAILAALVVLVAVGAAAAQDMSNIVRGHVVYVEPTGDANVDGIKLEADSATGLGVSYERLLSGNMGLEFGIFSTDNDVEGSLRGDTRTIGEFSITPLTVGLNFHVAKSDSFDFYVGPVIAYVMYDDVDTRRGFGSNIGVDDDFGFGAVAGIELPGSGNWAFSAQLKYLATSAEASDEDFELDVNPWVIQAGAAYRF
ncbi:MAG: outer membrane beta-barrel protein [Acidobacteria bacterium]|nr:outer membrane beta-barrel protein [Acidobacteriota bacterium]